MKTKEGKNCLALVGRMDVVLAFLKNCEKDFTYLKDLITYLNTPNRSKYLN